MNLTTNIRTDALIVVESETKGQVFTCSESLSFWGGVDPDTGKIIDSHHPNHGVYLAGKIVLMPSSRGSCSGSGVLLQLARNNIAPAAIVFCEAEEILTLGAIIAAKLFDSPVAILRLPIKIYEEFSIDKIAYTDHGYMINSSFLNGLKSPDLSIKQASPTTSPPYLLMTTILSFDESPVVTISSTSKHLELDLIEKPLLNSKTPFTLSKKTNGTSRLRAIS